MGAEVWGPLSTVPPGALAVLGGHWEFCRLEKVHQSLLKSKLHNVTARGCRDPCIEGSPPCPEMCPAVWAGTCQSRDQCGQAAEREQGAGDVHAQKLSPAVGDFCSAPSSLGHAGSSPWKTSQRTWFGCTLEENQVLKP